jgi:hypothetical protein
MPNAVAWEEAGKQPSAELFKKLGESSFLVSRIAPGVSTSTIKKTLSIFANNTCIMLRILTSSWASIFSILISFSVSNAVPQPYLKQFKLFGDVKPEQFDYFHEMIAHEEISRIG